ncbi:Lecithin:cholesterol acyltransferase-domain-containing protein [Chytridium lagenaria]|nr:Lecithin:cholesterol acyltransferase-domain-containing protein [Chytridium lagenaria]
MTMMFERIVGDVDLASLLPTLTGTGIPGTAPNFTDIFKWFTMPEAKSPSNDEFVPGYDLAMDYGLKAKHPVVIIPGITSSHLEVWNTHPAYASRSDTTSLPCGLKYFRKRMWGTLNQVRAVFLDKECWMEHMMLDPETGVDPIGVKLRAAQGLDAADYLFPGYWVMAKIISNLAAIGYDNNNMHLASYDWRLSVSNLEARDLYFSKLKSTIELARRVVIVSHSMGSVLTHYFLQWVESDLGGQGGKKWTWVNIAGPMLGSPKTLPSVLSGEMRDTINLNTYASYVLEQFFSRKERRSLFRNWGGMRTLHPMGGGLIWGKSDTEAPDDLEKTMKFGTSTRNETSNQYPVSRRVIAAVLFVYGDYGKKCEKDHALHAAKSDQEVASASSKPQNWLNPLLCPLPQVAKRDDESSRFKIVCEYGVGIPTERKYFYADYGEDPSDERYLIHTGLQDEKKVVNGVLLSDGDISVPLISLGYMCANGWRRKRYNPSGIRIITREHPHKSWVRPSGVPDLRGGPESADHVDIMGNHAVIEDILRVAAGNDDFLEDKFSSEIRKISKRVKLPGDN